jgi:chromatin segregation and condensation protein Rec8/ScpA/Scc1 (kleisin family)
LGSHTGKITSKWRQTLAVVQENVTVGEMMEWLLEQLAASADEKLIATRLLEAQAGARRRSCLFLGMLEMARDQRVRIEQGQVFGEIWLSLGLVR